MTPDWISRAGPGCYVFRCNSVGIWVNAPRVVPDDLHEIGVAETGGRHPPECCGVHISAGGFDRNAERILGRWRGQERQREAAGAAKERGDIVGQQILVGLGQSGRQRDTGDSARFPTRFLAEETSKVGELFCGETVKQSTRSCLGDDRPTMGPCQCFGLVEHDCLADPPVPGEQGCPTGCARSCLVRDPVPRRWRRGLRREGATPKGETGFHAPWWQLSPTGFIVLHHCGAGSICLRLPAPRMIL